MSFKRTTAATTTLTALTRPGNRWVALGDSITLGSSTAATPVHGEGWVTYAALMSAQRLHLVYNAGISGNTTAQMLARFDTDVTPYAPNLVTIQGGINDIGGSVTKATWQSNIQAMVAKCLAIGARPVLTTIQPNNTAGRAVILTNWNMWLRSYGEKNGITVIDFYQALADAATGNYVSGFQSDGTHPSNLGYWTLGTLVASVLTPQVPNTTPQLPGGNVNNNNLLTDGLFLTDANTNGISDSWSPGSAPTGVTKTLVTVAGVQGSMQTFTMVDSSGLYVLSQTVSTGFSVGDILRLCGIVTADTAGPTYRAYVSFTGGGGSTPTAVQLTQPVTKGVFCADFTVPSGTTAVVVSLRAGGVAGDDGVVQFGQVGLFNLTTLGAIA